VEKKQLLKNTKRIDKDLSVSLNLDHLRTTLLRKEDSTLSENQFLNMLEYS
jgi:hypothetical protein